MEYEQAEEVETHKYESGDLATHGEPRMRINRLNPPAETSYFSRQTITFFNNHQIGGSVKQGRFTWRADVYIYATGARITDPDFTTKGQINVVLVHSGFVRIYDNFSADVWDKMRFDLTPKTSGLLPSLQLPSTGSGEQAGDDWNYKINYGENMPMFKNNGNEAFTFEARYEETFTRLAAKQTGSRSGFIQFLIETTKESSQHRNTDIYGLSVFTINNPAAFPLTLNRDFALTKHGGGWGVAGDIRINLGF